MNLASFIIIVCWLQSASVSTSKPPVLHVPDAESIWDYVVESKTICLRF
jgi:hypothetical protein